MHIVHLFYPFQYKISAHISLKHNLDLLDIHPNVCVCALPIRTCACLYTRDAPYDTHPYTKNASYSIVVNFFSLHLIEKQVVCS